MPDAPLEPELIDMPPSLASAPPMSSLERCIALRLVFGAGPRLCLQKMALAPHLSVSLLSRVSVVSCVLARTRVFLSWPPVPGTQTVTNFFFFDDGLKKCKHSVISAQCPECQSGENFKQARLWIASFCANAWLCALLTTDRHLDSSNTMKRVNA